MSKIPQEIIENALRGMRISYTVQTVYSCIKKGDALEIEDNRGKLDIPKHTREFVIGLRPDNLENRAGDRENPVTE